MSISINNASGLSRQVGPDPIAEFVEAANRKLDAENEAIAAQHFVQYGRAAIDVHVNNAGFPTQDVNASPQVRLSQIKTTASLLNQYQQVLQGQITNGSDARFVVDSAMLMINDARILRDMVAGVPGNEQAIADADSAIAMLRTFSRTFLTGKAFPM